MVPVKLKRNLCYIKGALYLPVCATSKGTCSPSVVEIKQPTVQGCRDQQTVSDWLSDAAQDNDEQWEALTAQHCPLPSSFWHLHTGSLHPYGNPNLPCDNISVTLRPPKLNSQFIVSNFYKKHAGGRLFFIIHCRFCPSSQCKVWPRPLTLSRAHKPVRQCKLNSALVSMINNE